MTAALLLPEHGGQAAHHRYLASSLCILVEVLKIEEKIDNSAATTAVVAATATTAATTPATTTTPVTTAIPPATASRPLTVTEQSGGADNRLASVAAQSGGGWERYARRFTADLEDRLLQESVQDGYNRRKWQNYTRQCKRAKTPRELADLGLWLENELDVRVRKTDFVWKLWREQLRECNSFSRVCFLMEKLALDGIDFMNQPCVTCGFDSRVHALQIKVVRHMRLCLLFARFANASDASHAPLNTQQSANVGLLAATL
ncbi:hypothetical protein CYMTET_31615 [Cymbomonas tetramitiformis]|uniref:Uncharacterized protein n=1 Tax=Cymbomonas tetramitiformis TaxID=36881 RepID=A0AAE0KT24_9CHLO|nr:hypothetical protein CYMTET_31615 [Cymbomonas tetramitiformis]